MLNYPLTEFTLKELRVLSEAITLRIEDKQIDINRTNKMWPSSVKRNLLSKFEDGLPELREMHVRVLTAIDIVKQKETTNAN